MAPERAPAFQFYPKDFLSDGKQAAMSLAEVGAYVRLLSVCWLEGSIPDDVTRTARIVGETPATMRKLWPAVRICFTIDADGTLRHKRLDRERVSQAARRQTQSANGKQGGRPTQQKATANPNGSQHIRETEAEKSSPVSNLQLQEPPKPPSGEGGRLTRKHLAAAEKALREFRASQPRYVYAAHREPGVEYPDPKNCPHEPECGEDAICVARIASAQQARVVEALSEGAS